MKILIISGFLGAGKTTFIKELARRTGKEFAILENEFGAVGIDGDRLRSGMTAGEVNIMGAGGRLYLLFDEGGFCGFGPHHCEYGRS